MADLIRVDWYATVFRQHAFAKALADVAPIALRYGATRYEVHVSNDDRYKIYQATWMPSHDAWYSYWEGPEMIEFRARNSGRYQVPVVYAWMDEIAVGSLGPEAEERARPAEERWMSSPGPA
ncbi:MAG TPA: hypothetical protein VFW09_08260 [Solirubrobacteraceae bacterium]|jgi:hypothetical protein|nr:hypothetical protein [Solirubrobacteraceae bacterium]